MSEVFLSYKREDEVRVGRLARALEGAGFSVWWDRSLAGGENWRGGIQNALDRAACVVVVWTHESVGPAGDFVRDEAVRAKRRGVLVPVALDRVDPPMGFGEIQAIDLAHWRGGSRDPFFQDLVAAVQAKSEGRAVPPATGPAKRLARRLTYSGLASAMAFGGVAFGLNAFHAQDGVCGVPLLQPRISDVCGALGLGNRPSKGERIAWERREPGSCADLRRHIERFPGGAYRDEAASMLAGRRVTQTEVWTPATRRLELVELQGDVPSATAAAKADALARAATRAERRCKAFAVTSSFRFKSAMPVPQVWNCSPLAQGVTCGLEGEAVCDLDERSIQEYETCGK